MQRLASAFYYLEPGALSEVRVFLRRAAEGAGLFIIMPYFVYLLKCADDSFYAGMTENLELRLAQHQQGLDSKSYTFSRRPVTLAWSQDFPNHDEAFRAERQIKGWSRAKEEGLIRGDWDGIHTVVKRNRQKQDMRRGKKKAP